MCHDRARYTDSRTRFTTAYADFANPCIVHAVAAPAANKYRSETLFSATAAMFGVAGLFLAIVYYCRRARFEGRRLRPIDNSDDGNRGGGCDCRNRPLASYTDGPSVEEIEPKNTAAAVARATRKRANFKFKGIANDTRLGSGTSSKAAAAAASISDAAAAVVGSAPKVNVVKPICRRELRVDVAEITKVRARSPDSAPAYQPVHTGTSSECAALSTKTEANGNRLSPARLPATASGVRTYVLPQPSALLGDECESRSRSRSRSDSTANRALTSVEPPNTAITVWCTAASAATNVDEPFSSSTTTTESRQKNTSATTILPNTFV